MYTIFFTSTDLATTFLTTSEKNSDASRPFDIMARSHFIPLTLS